MRLSKFLYPVLLQLLALPFLSGQCPTPFLLPVQDIQTDSATIRWFQSVGTADSFSLDIARADSSLDGIPDTTGISGENVRLGQLLSGTRYHYRIRAHCSHEISNWTSEGFFVTDLTNPSVCPISLPLSDNNCNGGYYPDRYYISVEQMPGDSLGIDLYLESVSFIIEHYWPADLSVVLTSPSGRSVTLFEDAPIGGNHFGDIDDAECSSVFRLSDYSCAQYDTASPPFIGSFQPQEPLNRFNDSSLVNGRWTLSICDRASNASGEEAFLKFVSLNFTPSNCRPPTDLQIQRISDSSLLVNKSTHGVADSLLAILIHPDSTPDWPPPMDASIYKVSTDDGQDTVSGLIPASSYQLYYISACDSQYSQASCPLRFNTLCSRVQSFLHFDDLSPCPELCSPACTVDSIWRNSGSSYWSLHKGPTSTPGTGPEGDAFGSGLYIYHENSPSLCSPGTAVLESSCLKVNAIQNTCDLSFKYHMFGLDIGTLKLEYTTDGGANWTTLWEKSGNHGNHWYAVQLSLDSLNGESVRLRFISTGHTGSRSDVALDEIALHSLIPAPPSTFYLDSDGDLYGTVDSQIIVCRDSPPVGFVREAGDCNDSDSTINPEAQEVHCNLIDENCNGLQDDPAPGGLDYVVSERRDIHCSGDSSGRIRLEAHGGVPPYEYQWNTGSDSSVIQGLTEGVYYCTITDQSGCLIRTEFIELTAEVSLNFSLLEYRRPECSSENSGLLELGIGGGQPPYDINWDTGDTTARIDSLSPGTYQATVTETSGCTFTSPKYQLPAISALEPFILRNPPSCSNEADGSILLQVNGGQSPYTYEWSTGDTTKNISGLSEGVYSVSIQDADQCLRILDSISLNGPGEIELTVSEVREIRCHDASSGSIDIEVQGGTPPYSYIWTNGVQNFFTQDLQQLEAGMYSLTVTDQNGCSAPFLSIALDQPDPIGIDSLLIDPANCINSYDGSIELSARGGVPPYQFVWSNGRPDTNYIDSLKPGNYFLTIADVLGCRVDTFSFEVPNREQEILVNLQIVDTPSCSGFTDGQLIAGFPEIQPPIQYLWNTGKNGMTDQFTDTLGMVEAGNYSITVTDGRGCTGSASIVLPEPNPLVLDSLSRIQPLCHGDSSGSLRAHVSGGTPPLAYIWSDNNIGPLTDSIPAGTYQLTVTDDHNCIASFGPYFLDEPDSINWNLSVEHTQNGMSNGSLSWLIVGGSPPFTPQWSPMEGEQHDQSITGLPAGTYHLSLIDQQGCSVDTVISIDGSVFAYTSGSASGITLYPMPVDENLIIAHQRSEAYTWSIHEMSGKRMARGHSRQQRTTINCGSFPSGLYLLRIRFAYSSPIAFKVPVIH